MARGGLRVSMWFEAISQNSGIYISGNHMPTEQARNLIAYKRTRVTSVQGEHTHACKRKLKLKSEKRRFSTPGDFTFRTSQPHFVEASWHDFPAYCAGIASASWLGGN
jgi:hypothetical protein